MIDYFEILLNDVNLDEILSLVIQSLESMSKNNDATKGFVSLEGDTPDCLSGYTKLTSAQVLTIINTDSTYSNLKPTE